MAYAVAQQGRHRLQVQRYARERARARGAQRLAAASAAGAQGKDHGPDRRLQQLALEVHDLKTRIAGRATFVEFHLVVDADMSVGTSHVICDRIEEALKSEIPSVRVIIHVEPDDEAKLPAGTVAVPFA